MERDRLYTEDMERLRREIRTAEENAHRIKLALLRHYLLNFILYSNLDEDDRADSPITEKLSMLSVLLDKIKQMEKKVWAVETRRTVDRQMMRNKDDTRYASKRHTPRDKYERRSRKLAERVKKEDDPNIEIKKSKSNKFR